MTRYEKEMERQGMYRGEVKLIQEERDTYKARAEQLAARESRLWACLEKLMIYVPIPRGQRKQGSGHRQIDADNAIKSRDLPALCAALGVDHE